MSTSGPSSNSTFLRGPTSDHSGRPMTNRRSRLAKARDYWQQRGVLRTLGAMTRYCGTEVEYWCQSLHKMYEWDRGQGYPLFLRGRAARHGFSAHSYLWLGLGSEDRDIGQYLNSTKRIWKLNSGYIEPIHDKYTFQRLTEPHIDALPTLYGRIDGGEFVSTTATSPTGGLLDVLGGGERLVLKPTTGSKGGGIHIVERTDGAFAVDGRSVTRGEVESFVAGLDGYIATEFVAQHAYVDSIYPDATNTLRVFSIVDPDTGEASVLRAAHRFGSAESAPTDNWSRGGYCAPVDIDTGRIGRLITLDDPPRSRHERHPETGAPIAGVTVPYWEEVRELVRTVADLHRQAPLVGWDIAVGEEGPILIEGNERPGKELLQLERGVFEDPRARRLFGSF